MKKSLTGTNNTCANPLKLSWNDTVFQYKVNKPQDQSGQYVDKAIADALLKELQELKDRILTHDPDFNIPSLNEAIANALKK